VILQAWGRLEEALSPHKKKGSPLPGAANRKSLGYCYWSWGLLAPEQRDLNTDVKSYRWPTVGFCPPYLVERQALEGQQGHPVHAEEDQGRDAKSESGNSDP
jgi:hypothetical protein